MNTVDITEILNYPAYCVVARALHQAAQTFALS
jgi:hypothetical protein